MEKRLSKISNIRAVAILMVVLGHSIILYSSTWGLYETVNTVPFLDNLKKIINIIQMPLFFSLSGYLFKFTHAKKRGILKLIQNKALRLLIPYVGIALFFLLPIRLVIRFSGYQNMGVIGFIRKLLTTDDVGHLWFLPALFLVFFFAELLLMVVERIPGIKKYASVFLCVVSLALHMKGERISLGYLPLVNAFEYLLWFSLGYVLNDFQNDLQKVYGVVWLKWGLVALNLFLLIFTLFIAQLPLWALLGLKAFSIVTMYGAMPSKTCGAMEKIDRNSFGIYLFHSPLIYITYATISNAHPILVVFLNFVAFGAVAYGLTDLVRKTKLKVLIGE